jgi:esterase/lipase
MIWVLLVLLIILIVGFLYAMRFCFIISNATLTIPFPGAIYEAEEKNEEKVQFPAAGGQQLDGIWIPSSKKTDKTILFCHELGGDLNSWHKYASYLPEKGYNVFTFNFRNAPTKQDGVLKLTTGQWITRSDVDDVLSAIRFLKGNRPIEAKRVGILGISKGGNAALAALSRTNEIEAVVTDGAFSSIETILDYIKRWVPIYVPFKWLYSNTPDFLYRIMVRIGHLISSIKLGCWIVSIEGAIKKTNVPIFFIHGESDAYVSPHHANYLFNITNSVEELWIVPKARHNDSVKVSPDEYSEKVITFLKGAIQ